MPRFLSPLTLVLFRTTMLGYLWILYLSLLSPHTSALPEAFSSKSFLAALPDGFADAAHCQ